MPTHGRPEGFCGHMVYTGNPKGRGKRVYPPENVRGVSLEGVHPVRPNNQNGRVIHNLRQHLPEIQAGSFRMARVVQNQERQD